MTFPFDRADPEAAISAMAKRCSNWGRWAADDVRGTLNFLLDDAKRRKAATLTRRGAALVTWSPLRATTSPVRVRRQGWGDYAGGDAPGLSFTTAEWLHRSQIAAIATDTWGFEVLPNEFDRARATGGAVINRRTGPPNIRNRQIRPISTRRATRSASLSR